MVAMGKKAGPMGHVAKLLETMAAEVLEGSAAHAEAM
jgi:hypothetical protein